MTLEDLKTRFICWGASGFESKEDGMFTFVKSFSEGSTNYKISFLWGPVLKDKVSFEIEVSGKHSILLLQPIVPLEDIKELEDKKIRFVDGEISYELGEEFITLESVL